MMEKILMKLAVIYHSETENTKQAAEWIADGMNVLRKASDPSWTGRSK